MRKSIVLILMILALGLAACAPSYSRSAVATSAPAAAPSLQESLGAGSAYDANKTTGSVANGTGSGPVDNAPLHSRLVIKNVSLSIVVKDPQAKMDAINALAAEMGGWVVSSNLYQTYTSSGATVPEGTISIRVPSAKLDSAVNQIKADAISVQSQSSDGQDVTSQYTDLQSQLNNLQAEEADLLAIMDEAKNNPNSSTSSQTQDVLNVYSQIVQVRGQIEQIKGQMQYFQESSDTSLITVTLIAEETVKPIVIGGWKPEGKMRDAVQKLINFLEGFVNFLIYLVILVVPILIVIFGPIALVIWGIVAIVRRRKAKKVAAAK
jgi:hypothetical protein